MDNAAVDVAEKEKADELRLDSVEYNNLDDRQREILETNCIVHCGCHVENLYGQAFTSKDAEVQYLNHMQYNNARRIQVWILAVEVRRRIRVHARSEGGVKFGNATVRTLMMQRAIITYLKAKTRGTDSVLLLQKRSVSN